MPRTIIDIPASQLTEIDSICRKLGMSRAAVVRQALASYLERAADLGDDGFGLWRDPACPAPPALPAAASRRGKTR